MRRAVALLPLAGCFWVGSELPLRTTPGRLLWLQQHCEGSQCWIEPFHGPPSATDQDLPFAVRPLGTPGTVPLLACDFVGHNGRYTQLSASAECWGDYGQLLHVWVAGAIVPADGRPVPEMVELHEYALPPPAHGFVYRTGDRDPSNGPPGPDSGFRHQALLGWVVSAYEDDKP